MTLLSNCPGTADRASHSRLLWLPVWRQNPPLPPLGSLLSDRRPRLHQFSQLLHHRPPPPSPLRQHCPPRGARPRYQRQHRGPPFVRRSPRWKIQTPECLYSTRSATCSSPRETTTRPCSGCASNSATLPLSLPRAAAQPTTVRPNDGGDSEAEDDDDALAVPGFGSPASIADTGGGGMRWNSADTAGGTHGRVGPSTDDDDMPGLGNGGCWFGGGSGLMANARGHRNRCHPPLRWKSKGRVASGKLLIGPTSGVVAPAGPWRCRRWAWPVVEWPMWGPQGRTLLILDLLLLSQPPVL